MSETGRFFLGDSYMGSDRIFDEGGYLRGSSPIEETEISPS